MKNWQEHRFGDLVQFPPRVALRKGEEYPFIEMDAVDSNSRYVESPQRKKYESSSFAKFANGDVLLARITPCLENGKIAQVRIAADEGGFGSTEFFVFRAKGELQDQSFLFYLTKCDLIWKSAVNSMVGASGRQRADATFLKKLWIKIPKPPIQRKIAAVLSAYDELIDNNKRRIALLEKLTEEIYREWFVRLRFPGHEKVKVIKGVPNDWEVRTLGSFASEIKRGVKKRDLADDEKYVGLEHIPRRSIALKDWATGDTVDSNKLLFQDRDILFSKIRPYLHKVALAHFSGACSSDTIVIRPKEKLYEGYLMFTVFSDTFIELATVASKGTKMPRADWGFLRKLELAVPNKKLLELYQVQFDSVFAQIVNLLRANELLTNCRDRFLPRLISGKLSVENLDIQFPPGMAKELNAGPSTTAHA